MDKKLFLECVDVEMSIKECIPDTRAGVQSVC